MADTTIVHGAEAAVNDTVSGLAGAIGATTNEVSHHADAIAAQGEKLTNVEGNTEWLKTRLDNLEAAAVTAPSAAIADLRAEMAELKHELMAQTAALSEAIVQTTTEEPQTEAPPPQANEAEEKPSDGPLGGLRKALHRLL